MLTVQDFLDAGYRKYNQRTHNNSDYLVQKRVADEVGTKYFIHTWVYEHFNKEYYSRNPSLQEVSFMPEVRFRQQDKPTVNVILILDKEHQIKDIEEQFQEIWISLGKPYYSEYC